MINTRAGTALLPTRLVTVIVLPTPVLQALWVGAFLAAVFAQSYPAYYKPGFQGCSCDPPCTINECQATYYGPTDAAAQNAPPGTMVRTITGADVTAVAGYGADSNLYHTALSFLGEQQLVVNNLGSSNVFLAEAATGENTFPGPEGNPPQYARTPPYMRFDEVGFARPIELGGTPRAVTMIIWNASGECRGPSKPRAAETLPRRLTQAQATFPFPQRTPVVLI